MRQLEGWYLTKSDQYDIWVEVYCTSLEVVLDYLTEYAEDLEMRLTALKSYTNADIEQIEYDLKLLARKTGSLERTRRLLNSPYATEDSRKEAMLRLVEQWTDTEDYGTHWTLSSFYRSIPVYVPDKIDFSKVIQQLRDSNFETNYVELTSMLTLQSSIDTGYNNDRHIIVVELMAANNTTAIDYIELSPDELSAADIDSKLSEWLNNWLNIN